MVLAGLFYKTDLIFNAPCNYINKIGLHHNLPLKVTPHNFTKIDQYFVAYLSAFQFKEADVELCAYLLTFGISNYNTFHDKYSVVMTTLAYSKYEPFTYFPMNCKNAVFGKRFFSALDHSRNYPYPLHGEN